MVQSDNATEPYNARAAAADFVRQSLFKPKGLLGISWLLAKDAPYLAVHWRRGDKAGAGVLNLLQSIESERRENHIEPCYGPGPPGALICNQSE